MDNKKYNKKEEDERINQWIQKLNAHNRGWFNGDLENNKEKTADMVNHSINTIPN